MLVKLKNERYKWTKHVREKMKFYHLSEGRIKRIIRHPKRIEEGIAPQTVAVMQPATTKKYQEIWVMYQLKNSQGKSKQGEPDIIIITAWRYPGKSPQGKPIPKEILEEVRQLVF
jgi:hypothetical protein